MRPTEKIRSDIDRAFRATGAPRSADARSVAKNLVSSDLGFIPQEARDLVLESFLARNAADPAAATAWLGTVTGIFLQDYDDAPLSLPDWQELREIVVPAAGEMDLDLLTYVMALVVEHGAI